ncbi:MAG: hypothetical protein IRY99_05980 [Isosphaeraceae bacterium]|nr:hypothetical protein [Isosphaeraceae bacterium]
MSRKPPNHGTYEIWYEGRTLAVDVQSTGVREVERMTRRPPGRWRDHPAVKVHVENPRGTRLGDVIVDPTCGAWEVREDCYLAVDPPEPVAERMRREGIAPQHIRLLKEWTGHMQESLTGEEITVAVQEPCDPGESARSRAARGKEDGGPAQPPGRGANAGSGLGDRMRRLQKAAEPEQSGDRDLER